MKNEFIQGARLTVACLLLFCVAYTGIVWIAAQSGLFDGRKEYVTVDGKRMYLGVAQKFTSDRYFWPRPSAVDYDGAGSGGSNKGTTNPEYLREVEKRISDFTGSNPGIDRSEIPSELVTESGSGLDPDISVEGAEIQISRIAKARKIPASVLKELVKNLTEKPLLGIFGTEKINVLKLNIALDNLKQ